MKRINSQNHGLAGLRDFTDLKSFDKINLCHQRNPRKSVIQTTNLQKVKIDE